MLGVLWREAQAGHDGHVVDVQLVPVVGALAVVEIENIRQALFLVILGADILLLVRAVRARTLASVVDPADEVGVFIFFADAGEIGGEGSALHLAAFTDGMAGEPSTRLRQLCPLRSAAGPVRW